MENPLFNFDTSKVPLDITISNNTLLLSYDPSRPIQVFFAGRRPLARRSDFDFSPPEDDFSFSPPLAPGTFSVREDALPAPVDLAPDARGTRYILIRSYAELSDEECNRIESLGVADLVEEDDNIYVGIYEQNDLDELRRLDFLAYVDVNQRFFKISAGLRYSARTRRVVADGTSSDSTSPAPEASHINVAIGFFRRPVWGPGQVYDQLIAAGIIPPETIRPTGDIIHAVVALRHLSRLTRCDSIQCVLDDSGMRFDNNQGFGRVNVNGSLFVIEAECVDPSAQKEGGFVDIPDPVKNIQEIGKGSEHSYTIDITAADGPFAPTKKLKATLTWLDPGNKKLVYRLGLAVILGGKRRHGNFGPKKQKSPYVYDEDNNVQQVIWDPAPSGTATIIVKCLRLPKGTRGCGYALAWSLE
ncbi:hypothetical protein BDZ85DRAFT_277574 [Elsinoe ampelina]|uniref:Uncharacterized protein n=1 Tax=Elsinoe ampelina TaxID=302913 RepID=A0A6A6GPM7_9PEZI|nr:hypothetical protein BDZ85DRAFT_277574 [Elsinoe ampelina]